MPMNKGTTFKTNDGFMTSARNDTLLLNFGSPAKIEAVVIIDSPESSSNLSSFVGGGE